MESGNSEFMSDSESKEILEGNEENVEEALEESNPGKYALKSLIRQERDGQNRQEVLDLLKKRFSEEKVLDNIDSLSHQLSETEELLDKISIDKQKNELKNSKIVDKTVEELRKYLKNNELSEGQLQELLDEEKHNKDRKTAKKYIRKEIESTGSNPGLESLQEDLAELEDDVSNFKKELDKNREKFRLPETRSSNKVNDSEDEESKKELVKITNNIVEKLQNQRDLRGNEKLKDLVNDAFLALEAENYDTFKDKLHEIESLEEENSGNGPEDLAEQENKLERMESMVSELEERQEESLGVPKEAAEEVNEQLDTLEEMSDEEIERPQKTDREEKLEDLASKGFDKDNLKTRSNSDLERLEDSSEKADNLESKFESVESEQSNVDKTSEIEENIDKLEESLNSDNEESSSSLGKFEKKIKESKESEKKGILGLI